MLKQPVEGRDITKPMIVEELLHAGVSFNLQKTYDAKFEMKKSRGRDRLGIRGGRISYV